MKSLMKHVPPRGSARRHMKVRCILAVVKDPVLPNYPDHGCAVYPVCLECPLPYCIEDIPCGQQNVRLLKRAIEIDSLLKEGKSITQIAIRFNISQRTVRRALALLKPVAQVRDDNGNDAEAFSQSSASQAGSVEGLAALQTKKSSPSLKGRGQGVR